MIRRTTKKVLDIGCAPGSWLQYTIGQLKKFSVKDYAVIGLDLKAVDLHLPGLRTYVQDATQVEEVKMILEHHQIAKFDFIQSDMAPNTIGLKDIDAMRAIDLLEQTYWIYDQLLDDNGSFVIKVFMGP